ncbi:hypothetical protein PY650_35650 [Rhizobium calliandrae]|uniref:Uncharacterized protein n=1 Tax=Rhizobium calliandrae TaxID=1312182 RepID=A0ABT7KQP3_9HYPH|nr:hypothetical protein [Rhizobium calliandrae]MDL2410786.1 hypothetical protein [Rhizobium calliandrae]
MAMWNSIVLDVGIGLAFMYFLLALACSVIQELIANVTSWRGRHLLNSIKVMLNDPAMTGLAKRVYSNPRIRSLSLPGKLPSYIPSAAFAKAIVDTFSEQGMLQQSSPAFQGPLSPFLRDAAGDVDKLQASIETWFDNAMDRFGGWYKRNVQLVLLAIAFFMAAAVNGSTFEVARQLWSQPMIRAAVESQAANIVRTTPTDATGGQQMASPDLEQLTATMNETLPIGWTASSYQRLFRGLEAEAAPTVSGSEVSVTGTSEAAPRLTPLTTKQWIFDWIEQLSGWVLTALAASLGAQFWFDTLGEALGIRAAGNRPTSKSR